VSVRLGTTNVQPGLPKNGQSAALRVLVAQAAFGWAPKVEQEDGLRRMIEWVKGQSRG
jgi:nucleoside-diphosphate-sugar epimerase